MSDSTAHVVVLDTNMSDTIAHFAFQATPSGKCVAFYMIFRSPIIGAAFSEKNPVVSNRPGVPVASRSNGLGVPVGRATAVLRGFSDALPGGHIYRKERQNLLSKAFLI